MLDYRGIEALSAVVEFNSFEGAASKLHITQSAVSQRIKALERHYGEPAVIRMPPYKPTTLGKLLISHFKQVSLLEGTLGQQMGMETAHPNISIAINRDSLETWFLDLVEEKKLLTDFSLEIVADDQELTLQYLKNGVVSACLSTSSKEIVGGIATFLGNMEYLMVASPGFAERHFSSKNQDKNLLESRALKFDRNDYLHERYLQEYFGLDGRDIEFQIIPSIRGFKSYILLGYGYGLIPKIDITNELQKKQLVDLFPKKTWKIPLYWHHWVIESKHYQEFNANIIKYAKRRFHV